MLEKTQKNNPNNPFFPYVATPFLPYVQKEGRLCFCESNCGHVAKSGGATLRERLKKCLKKHKKQSQQPLFPICGDPISPICQKIRPPLPRTAQRTSGRSSWRCRAIGRRLFWRKTQKTIPTTHFSHMWRPHFSHMSKNKAASSQNCSKNLGS